MVSERPSYSGSMKEFYCVSTDTKPTGERVKNGSTLIEMDTNKRYMFDAENQTWTEWTGGSSGSGAGFGSGSGSGSGTDSGSGNGPYIVNMELLYDSDQNSLTLTSFDGTYADLYQRISSGESVILHARTMMDISAGGAQSTLLLAEGHEYLSIMLHPELNDYVINSSFIISANYDLLTICPIVIDSSDSVSAQLCYYTPLQEGSSSGDNGGNSDSPSV